MDLVLELPMQIRIPIYIMVIGVITLCANVFIDWTRIFIQFPR